MGGLCYTQKPLPVTMPISPRGLGTLFPPTPISCGNRAAFSVARRAEEAVPLTPGCGTPLAILRSRFPFLKFGSFLRGKWQALPARQSGYVALPRHRLHVILQGML